MATSGYIQGSISQKTDRYKAYLFWQDVSPSQDWRIANNASIIRIYSIVDSQYSTSNWNGSVSSYTQSIDGQVTSYGNFVSNSSGGWTWASGLPTAGRPCEAITEAVASYVDYTIQHNADGTKTVSFSHSYSLPSGGYGPGNVNISGSFVLDTIPRTTLLNSFTDFQIEVTAGVINGNLTIYSSSFSHYVQLLKNGVERAAWSIGAGSVGSTNFALTLSEAQRNAIFADMPSTVSDVFTLVVTTFNGGTQIGSGQSRNATGTIPSGYKPSISNANSGFSWANKNGALAGYLIQNISTLTLLLSGGVAPYGASLASYQVRFGTVIRSGGYSGAAISENVGLITSYGNLYAYYAVADSRGRWSEEISELLSVQAYNPPTSNGFDVRRNTSVATSADFILKFSNSLYSLGNAWTYTLQYWNGSSWVQAKAATVIAAASIDSIFTHALPYSESNVYSVKAILTDQFYTVEFTDELPTSAFPLSFGKRGIGVGKDTSDTFDLEVGGGGISSEGPIRDANGILTANKVLYGVNLDNVLTPGMYRVESCSGLPVAQDYCQLLVVVGGGDTISQTFYDWWDGQTYIRVGTFAYGSMVSRYGWQRIPKVSEIPSVILGNTSLQLIRMYPILMFNTVVEQTSNAYGFAFSNFGTLQAGVTYLLEVEGSITSDATAVGYCLMCILYNNNWTYNASMAIYDSVVKKWFYEFTPNATELINIGFWHYPSSGNREGSSYVRFWRLWKKY